MRRGDDEFYRAKARSAPMKARDPWVSPIPDSNELYRRRKDDPLPTASPFWILKTRQAKDE